MYLLDAKLNQVLLMMNFLHVHVYQKNNHSGANQINGVLIQCR